VSAGIVRIHETPPSETSQDGIAEEVVLTGGKLLAGGRGTFEFWLEAGKTSLFRADSAENLDSWRTVLEKAIATRKSKGPGKGPPPLKGGKGKGKGKGKRKSVFGETMTLRPSDNLAAAVFGLTVGDGEGDGKGDEDELPTPSFTDTRIDPTKLYDTLRAQFETKKPAEVKFKAKAKAVPSGKQLLDTRVAQNLGIVFKALHVDMGEVVDALNQLDLGAKVLSSDFAVRILEVWPSAHELEILQEFRESGEDPELLRDVDRQLLQLTSVPRVVPRLQMAVFVQMVAARVATIMKETCALQVACGELQKSSIVRDLLLIVLVVYNYVNYGNEVGTSSLRGVDVESLLRLHEMKVAQGDFPGATWLHMVVKMLMQQRPELQKADIEKELRSVPAASRVNLDAVREELDLIREGRDVVLTEINRHGPAYGGPEPVPYIDDSLSFIGDSEIRSPESAARGSFVQSVLFVPKTVIVAATSPLARTMEYVGSLGSLTSGKAVLGSATVSKDFPPLVPCDDAGDPIPSEVYVQRGTGRWQRCKCQVHGYLLMVQLLGRSTGAVRMTMFVVLLGSTFKVDEDGSFSVTSATDASRFRAKSDEHAQSWVDLLEAQAHCGGMMLVHECGKLVAGVEHKRCAVTLHDERIRVFPQPRDGVMDVPPHSAWDLDKVVIRRLDGLESSSHASKFSKENKFGFELVDPDTQHCWQFLCDSNVEERSWLEQIRPESRTLERAQSSRIVADLQTSSLQKSIIMEELRFEMGQATYPSESEFQKLARGFSGVFRDEDTETVLNCEESDRSRFRSVGTQDLSMVPSGRPESTIESDVDDSFIAEKREGDVSDPSPQESPFDRLVKLELDMTEQIVECTALLSGVEADCQALLDFFAPNVPSTESAVSAGLRIVNSMAEFKSQLEKAWDTVSEHQRKSEAGSKGARGRRGKGRGKKAEREPDETFHDAVESLES